LKTSSNNYLLSMDLHNNYKKQQLKNNNMMIMKMMKN